MIDVDISSVFSPFFRLIRYLRRHSFACALLGIVLLIGLTALLRTRIPPMSVVLPVAARPTAALSATPVPSSAPESVCPPVTGRILRRHTPDTLTWWDTLGQYAVHTGIDIAAPLGSPVRAVKDGVICAAYTDDFLGHVMEIRHGNDLTRYANLAQLPSSVVGRSVGQGEVIGTVGRSALSEAGDEDHLHFEWEQAGILQDPALLLPG